MTNTLSGIAQLKSQISNIEIEPLELQDQTWKQTTCITYATEIVNSETESQITKEPAINHEI